MEDYKNADFQKYYCNTTKRNFWMLGYFGGGAIPIADAYEVAKDYSKANNVKLEEVRIDEVKESSRCKYFKYVYAIDKQTKEKDSMSVNNFYEFIR